MPTGVHSALVAALDEGRERTLALVAPLGATDLERVVTPLMSPLDWDLGHIAAYEDLWLVHRHGGEPLLRGDLSRVYDAFETPRAARGDAPLLHGDDVFAYLRAVRERAVAALDRAGPGDGTVFEMVLRHELQHQETMRQTLFLAGLPGGRSDAPAPRAPAQAPWIDVPGGACAIGADGDGFAFDNERGRHRVRLGAFRIARRPVTTATWLSFAEGGGYERREWWSDEGWSWKEEYDITHPDGWDAGPGRPVHADERPVEHVSWFEADAFARAHGARLPTEAEWERAATWEQDPIQETGRVWEWTTTQFGGYPGFVAHPYPEYSAAFFDAGHRVLRGGSWATSPRVATRTFRNWDLPQRRQIFSGLRLATDP
jgi:iron(II)-dependent oxidoreductase